MQLVNGLKKLIWKNTVIVFFSLSLLWFSGVYVYGQQTSVVTNYMFTHLVFNPAAIGQSGGISITGLIRESWFGFKDEDGNKVTPEDIFISADAPVRVLHGGVGGMVEQDKIGFFNNTIVKLGYAFKTELGPGYFSAGAQLDFQNGKYDYSKFKPSDPNDELLRETGTKSDMLFDVDIGLFYRVPDKYYVGISGVQLLQTKGKNTNYQLKRTFFVEGGYQWDIPNHPAFQLQPSAIVMSDGAAFQFDVSGLVWYNNKFYGGLGYRLQDAVSILAGLAIKGFRLGISYDIGTSKMMTYSNGSFEVMLNYVFKVEGEKFRRSYHNTRYL
jgi:type IX secretion system PorP/SprF family membrane protein